MSGYVKPNRSPAGARVLLGFLKTRSHVRDIIPQNRQLLQSPPALENLYNLGDWVLNLRLKPAATDNHALFDQYKWLHRASALCRRFRLTSYTHARQGSTDSKSLLFRQCPTLEFQSKNLF